MAVFCITTSNPEFQKLLAESGEKQGVFAMMVSKWMTENEIYDRYPTLQELGISPITSIKPGVQELFESSPKLANNLENKLKNFLTSINVDTIVVDNLQKRLQEKGLNSDAVAVSDILHKAVFLDSEKYNTLDYAEEVATFAIEFMGASNHPEASPLIKTALANITTWEKYQQYYDLYKDNSIYKNNERKLKVEILSKLLAEKIVENKDKTKKTKQDKKLTTLETIINNILALFDKIWKSDYYKAIDRFLKQRGIETKGINKINIRPFDAVINEIVDDILFNNTSKIVNDSSRARKGETVVSLKEILENNSTIKEIYYKLNSLGFMFTGSPALSNQGTIYRESNDTLHDLDWQVPKELENNWLDLIKETFPGLTYKINPKTNQAQVFTKGEKTTHSLMIKGMPVDFFINVNPPSGRNKFGDMRWQDTFEAKLDIGRNKDIRDLIDFKTSFNDYFSNPKYVYYSLGQVKPGVEELFDSNPELANSVYEVLGFETTSIDLTPHELTSKPIGSPLDQSEGTGICDGTCGLMANRLQQAGMPYGHTQIEDKIANYHAVALTEINGKRYILNQPQHEFLSIEYQKAPLWERAMFWRGMSQRFNRHLPRILNDLYFSEGINPYPALFGTIESEYFGEIGPIFKDKKIIKREGYSVVTGTLIENPSVRIAIKLEEGETLENINPEEADVQTTKDGEKVPVWTKTEFTPRFIEVTKENLIKEYQLTNEQADVSIKAINEAIINPGTKIQITPQQKQQALQQYSQYLDTIFPDSKVKDIVYHDTSSEKLIDEGFKKEFIGIGDGTVSGDGFYFYIENNDKKIYDDFIKSQKNWMLSQPNMYPSAQNYTEEDWDKEFQKYKKSQKRYDDSRSFKIPAILKISKPLDKLGDKYSTIQKKLKKENPNDLVGFYKVVASVLGLNAEQLAKNTDEKYEELRWKGKTDIKSISDFLSEKYGYDSILGALSKVKEIVVFEPEQIHILGSKQDIEGFKSFVGNVEDVATDIGLDMSSDEAKAFNSLVNDGTISIKCE